MFAFGKLLQGQSWFVRAKGHPGNKAHKIAFIMLRSEIEELFLQSSDFASIGISICHHD